MIKFQLTPEHKIIITSRILDYYRINQQKLDPMPMMPIINKPYTFMSNFNFEVNNACRLHFPPCKDGHTSLPNNSEIRVDIPLAIRPSTKCTILHLATCYQYSPLIIVNSPHATTCPYSHFQQPPHIYLHREPNAKIQTQIFSPKSFLPFQSPHTNS